MIRYENKKTINSHPNEIFNIFLDNAKDTFGKINLKNPVGTKTVKDVKRNSKGKKVSKSTLELTDFKKDKIYEITFKTEGQVFISRYVLNKISDNETELISIEKVINNNPNKILDFITKSLYSSKVKKRFNYIVADIEHKIKKVDAF